MACRALRDPCRCPSQYCDGSGGSMAGELAETSTWRHGFFLASTLLSTIAGVAWLHRTLFKPMVDLSAPGRTLRLSWQPDGWHGQFLAGHRPGAGGPGPLGQDGERRDLPAPDCRQSRCARPVLLSSRRLLRLRPSADRLGPGQGSAARDAGMHAASCLHRARDRRRQRHPAAHPALEPHLRR